MKKVFLSGFVLVMVFLFSYSASAQPEQDTVTGQETVTETSKRISTVQIKGNKSVSTTTIINKLKLKPGDIFLESALNKELKRLYATGYFSDVFVETEVHAEGVIVTFVVVEKPIVEKIEFRGNVRIKSPRLSQELSVKEGTLLDFNLLSQDVNAIKIRYVEEGYSKVGVDYEIETKPDTEGVTVVFLVNEGQSLKIRSIKIEGNENLASSEIEKYMATKTEWWFIRKGAFDEEKFQTDLDRIATVYRSKGFLDVRVDSTVEYSPDGQDIHLTILVDEGKEYTVGEISVIGNLAFPENEIREQIKIKSGTAFDFQKIKGDVDNIRAFYYDKGYMDADIGLRHKYNSSTDRMDLIYDIQSHDEIYVGRINVIGNTKTKDKIIRRALRVYPGAKYDGKKLKRSKERIYNLGFFEDVYFETTPTDRKDVNDLNVTVKETKTGELSFGGGYSSIDAFIGFVQIRQRNFDAMDFPTFTGAGQDLTVRGEIGSARTNYFLSWTDPWVLDYPLLFGADLYRQEHKKYGLSGYDYNEMRFGGSARLGKELTDELSTGLVYNLEEVKISDIPGDASEGLKAELGTNTLSRLTWDLRYDTRNNKYSPSQGWISGMSLENAGGFIGGNRAFVKGYIHSSFYYSIFEGIVLELKARFGLASSYAGTEDVPVYERFFAGGAATIRGYKERAVGPRDSAALFIGGNALAIGNAEVTFPLFKDLLKGAVFYDIGNVMQKPGDLFKTSGGGEGYKMGFGAGVRVKTPIGPVKLDYGYPLSENHGDKKEGQFYFSVSHGF